MDRFELVTTMVDRLRGKDASVYHEILEKALNGHDPYTVRVPQVPILDVSWCDGVNPRDLIVRLQQNERMEVDEKIVAAFGREKNREDFPFSFYETFLQLHAQVMVQFDPHLFGIEYAQYERSDFGATASIHYERVVEAALKYGFKQPNLVSALYFRLRFLDAHRYTEGTRYYIACKPLVYADDKPPIIPVLDYDRYRGWSIRGQEVDAPLNMSFGTGQGEHFESTFVFVLPRQ